jgi:pyridoxine 5-phosphate synthase
MCTLVPEKRLELTTEGGLDVRCHMDAIKSAVERLRGTGIPVSLFIDADPDQIKAADRVGADFIEIHTGGFAEAADWTSGETELIRIENGVKLAQKLGLGINAGHGLNYLNIKRITAIRGIEEYNIGHAIIARAALIGLERAVRDMVELVRFA